MSVTGERMGIESGHSEIYKRDSENSDKSDIQRRLIKDFAFSTSKILFCPLVITETGHFMGTRRLFVDFTLFKVDISVTQLVFIYLFIVIESNDYRYTRSSLTANEIKTVLISIHFFHIAKKKYKSA